MCLLDSQPVAGGAGLRSTACHLTGLAAGGVGEVTFTVLGLEPGEHTLTFTLRTQQGQRDIVEKKLRVVVRTCTDDTSQFTEPSVVWFLNDAFYLMFTVFSLSKCLYAI